jgi:osmoprotectant transport system permease protein
MDIIREALQWLLDAEQYQGPGSLPQRTLEHLFFTGISVGLAALVALPVGYLIGHTGRGRVWFVGLTGAARALPSFGLILLLVLLFGVSHREVAAIIALVLLAIPPLLAGAYSGVHQIPRSVIDAARAQGMTEAQIVLRVEVPLSLPVVLGGLRSAVLQVVATATLVAYVGLGGLGYGIIQGIPLRRFDQTFGTALVIVLLALALDAALAWATRVATPRGVGAGKATDVRARGVSAQPAGVLALPRNETRDN